MESQPSGKALIARLLVLAVGVGYAVRGLVNDISAASGPPLAIAAFVLLGLALLIALGFEFVNGFHDTANAVATVIYTRSLAPTAVVVGYRRVRDHRAAAGRADPERLAWVLTLPCAMLLSGVLFAIPRAVF